VIFNAWMALALLAGLVSVIAYYKHSRWLGCLILFGLPLAVVALFGWPHDPDFVDTSLFSVVLWAAVGFIGVAVGTTAVVLRIVR
jgi:hypothetical protein